jgi:hypothetical protein
MALCRFRQVNLGDLVGEEGPGKDRKINVAICTRRTGQFSCSCTRRRWKDAISHAPITGYLSNMASALCSGSVGMFFTAYVSQRAPSTQACMGEVWEEAVAVRESAQRRRAAPMNRLRRCFLRKGTV